ncbi:flagellar hook-associated protein 1 FlgK [Lachnospiraceae bacterium]|nr:flagellar hook-associated protein 1 FlgK [Lachnospiraceae bacterium]
MPLMGAFYVGVSGLQTSQYALNTTAHNLANLDTKGYTRQQVYQANRTYTTVGHSFNNDLQVGLGTNYQDVRAVRDAFYDRQYRTENGRSGYYSTSYEAILEINTLFGETEGNQFQAALQNFQQAFQNLATNPSNATMQGNVVTVAEQFLQRAQHIYNGLAEYQNNLNQQIKDQVNQINKYADQIALLNDEIAGIEAGGFENANDLRDARNVILDELSARGRIEYKEDLFGRVNVQFEGVDLVKGDSVNHMEAAILEGDEESGFYTPVWPAYKNQKVFSETQEISADAGSDSGSLKALYFSRGKKNATYKDMEPSTGVDKNGNPVNYTAAETFDMIANSSITAIMTEFDHMINGMVTKINNLLTGYSEDGSTVINPNATGNLKLFTEITPNGDDTTMNLTVNSELLLQPTLLNNGFILDDQSVDQDTADRLAKIFSDKFSTLNPGTATPLTFEEYYIGIVNQYANIGNTYKKAAEAQEVSVLSLDNSRQQVMGVSDNEELTKMIRFQNAYNASSRYINTVNAMLDNLLSIVS